MTDGREMDQKQEFKEGLARMREKAAANSNHLTIADILDCFSGQKLSRHQIQLIYRYADEERMVIEDYIPHDTRSVSVGKPVLTGEEKAYFRMYLSDLRSVSPCTAEERESLLERLADGDMQARNRLTEGHLHMVLDLAKQHAGRGVLIGDLVQEGNMALVAALAEMAGPEAVPLLAGGLEDFLSGRIRLALEQIIEEQSSHKKAGERIARETNRLLAATLELEEELGREATLPELAEKVHLPEEKVKELIQISLNAAEFANRDTDGSGQPRE